MATRAQKTKVGLFVVVCAAIIVAGVLIISGYKNEVRIPYWVEFDESILGLGSGGIVEYLGVPVGTVDNIYVTDSNKPHCEILITADKVKLRQGVKAQLVMYSLATGTMCISLRGGDPNAPILPPGSQIEAEKSLVKSLSTQIEGALDNVNKISETIRSAMANMQEGDITKLLHDADDLIVRIQGFVDEASKTMTDIKGRAEAGMDDFRALAKDVRGLVKETGDTVRTVGNKVADLNINDTQDNLNKVLKDMSALSERLQESARTIDGMSRRALHEADNVEYNLRETLRTLNDSLQSIRDLTQYLQQDPSSLIRGKGKPRGER